MEAQQHAVSRWTDTPPRPPPLPLSPLRFLCDYKPNFAASVSRLALAYRPDSCCRPWWPSLASTAFLQQQWLHVDQHPSVALVLHPYLFESELEPSLIRFNPL